MLPLLSALLLPALLLTRLLGLLLPGLGPAAPGVSAAIRNAGVFPPLSLCVKAWGRPEGGSGQVASSLSRKAPPEKE